MNFIVKKIIGAENQKKIDVFFFAESFFLCRLNQNVCTGPGTSRFFKLNWLSLKEDSTDTYQIDYVDKADVDSILMNVNLKKIERDTFKLPSSEKKEIDSLLKKIKLLDMDEDEDLQLDDVSDDEHGELHCFIFL